MNTSKTIILVIATFVALAILIMIIQLLLRKVQNKNSEAGKTKLSYGIWFAGLFLSGSLIIANTISFFAEAVDNIYKIYPSNAGIESFKTGSLFIGLSIGWLILWYFIVNILSILVIGKRNEVKEVETDNYSFFLVRGIILIGFAICLLPIFAIILRALMPSVQTPFYH
jgi:hypothetical protein